MRWLHGLAAFWWRWLLFWTFLLGSGMCILAILPWTSWLPAPKLISATPDTEAVPLNQSLELQFSTAMDRASVEQALVVTPQLPGTWHWSNDTTARWIPETGWVANTTYRVVLSTKARSRFRQALEQSYQWSWTTVSAPVITESWPLSSQVLEHLSTPIVLQFDRPIMPITSPVVVLDPPVSTSQTWLTPQQVEVLVDWQPATTYTLQLAELKDSLGTPVRPSQWTIKTAAFELLDIQPKSNSTISAHTPLEWTIAGLQPAYLFDVLTTSLQLTPAYTGSWNINYTAEGATKVTFAPEQGWQTSTVSATLQLPGHEPVRWTWDVLEPLNLLATVPGSAGSIAPNEEVRLIFAAAPDLATVQQALRLEPPLEDLRLSHEGADVRIQGNFVASTSYTLTFQPDPTQPPLTIPFRTTESQMRLSIVAPDPSFSHWIPTQSPSITLQAENLQQVSASLYQLDRAVLIASLRASQPILQSQLLRAPALQTWSFENQQQATLTLTSTEGLYMFEARNQNTNEVVQHIVLISPVKTYLITNQTTAVVYVVDPETGQPLQGIDIVLLRQGSQVAQASTNENGLWVGQFTLTTVPDSVISVQEQPLVLGFETATLESQQASLQVLVDRPIVHQGELLHVLGIYDSYSSTPGLLRLYDEQHRIVDQQTIGRSANGAFATSFRIRSSYEPGVYTLDWATGQQLIYVEPPIPDGWRLMLPEALAPGEILSSTIQIQTSSGLPYASRGGSWSVVSNDQRWSETGRFVTDQTGTAEILIRLPQTLIAQTVIFQIELDQQYVQRSIIIRTPETLELNLTDQIGSPNQTLALTATVTNAQGQPLANRTVDLVVESNAAPEQIRGVSDSAGQVRFNWRLRGTGEVFFQAQTDLAVSERVPVWSTQRGFSNWSHSENALFVLSRDQVAPGESFQILPLLDTASGQMLVLMPTSTGIDTFKTDWTTGVPISLTLDPSLRGPQDLLVLFSTESGIQLGRTTIIQAVAQPNLVEWQAEDRLQGQQTQPLTYTVVYPPQIYERPKVVFAPTGTLDLQPSWTLMQTASATSTQFFRNSSPQTSTEWMLLAPPLIQQADRVQIYLFTQKDALNSIDSVLLQTGSEIQVEPQTNRDTVVPSQAWMLQSLTPGTWPLTVYVTPTIHLTTTLVVQATQPQPLVWQTSLVTTTHKLNSTSTTPVHSIVALPGIHAIREELAATLANDQSLLAQAGRIALAQVQAESELPTSEIVSLLGEQTGDGGWSWQGEQADPLLTAHILRFLGTGTPSAEVQRLIDRAAGYLDTLKLDQLDLNTQAVILAAQARYQTLDSQTLIELLENPQLQGNSQLMLLQALLDQRLDRRAGQVFGNLELKPLLDHSSYPNPWESSAQRAALLGQIAWKIDPASADSADIMRFIEQAWNPSWTEPIALTELLLLFQDIPLNSNQVAYKINTDQALLYSGVQPFSTSLTPTNTTAISIELASESALILAYSTPATQTIQLRLQLVDGLTNQPIDYGELGQLVRLNWTWYVPEPLEYVDFMLPHISTFQYIAVDASPFEYTEGRLRARQVEPGAYTISMLVYPTFEGTFHWSTPQLQTSRGIEPVSMAAPPLKIQ